MLLKSQGQECCHSVWPSPLLYSIDCLNVWPSRQEWEPSQLFHVVILALTLRYQEYLSTAFWTFEPENHGKLKTAEAQPKMTGFYGCTPSNLACDMADSIEESLGVAKGTTKVHWRTKHTALCNRG